MSAGYDPFYWLDWELDREYEKEKEREMENELFNDSRKRQTTDDKLF